MARTFSPQAIKKLRGQVFAFGGYEFQFTELPGWAVCMIAGGEGFATPIVYRTQSSPYGWSPPFVLKAFNEPTLRRRQRTAFLCALDLGQLQLPNNFFAGAPSRPFSHAFSSPQPIELEGYVARCVNGESFDDLIFGDKRPAPWDPPTPARISLARQLCLAVELLEGAGIVHGDLAPGNLMIVDADSNMPSLRLIDFDGFYHPQVPLLSSGEGRTWGTDGYRARAFKFRDESSVQTSDRVAMAVLVVELVVRRPDDVLDGDRLVLQDALDRGETNVSAEMAKRWPEGFELLRKAIAVADPHEAPSPREWRVALAKHVASGFTSNISVPAPVPESRFALRVIRHNQEPVRMRLPLPRGSFGSAAQELAWLAYAEEKDGLRLSGVPPMVDDRVPILMLQNSEDANNRRYKADTAAYLPWGGHLHWLDVQIELEKRTN